MHRAQNFVSIGAAVRTVQFDESRRIRMRSKGPIQVVEIDLAVCVGFRQFVRPFELLGMDRRQPCAMQILEFEREPREKSLVEIALIELQSGVGIVDAAFRS